MMLWCKSFSVLQAGWFTSDNASNNDTAMKEFGKIVDPGGTRWMPAQRRIRYVPYYTLFQ
jgi:hypothetical protein